MLISPDLLREFCPCTTEQVIKLTLKMRNYMGFLKMTYFNISEMLLYENPFKRTGHLLFIQFFSFKNPLDKPFSFFSLPKRQGRIEGGVRTMGVWIVGGFSANSALAV